LSLIFISSSSRHLEIVDLASEMDIIKKAGSWFSYGETRLGQGRENVAQLLSDNPELVEELEMKIKDKILGDVEE